MKYREEELLAYAKSRVHFLSIQKGKRAVLAVMFLGATIAPLLWLACVKEKFEYEHYGFLLEKHFLAGVFANVVPRHAVGWERVYASASLDRVGWSVAHGFREGFDSLPSPKG